jgi:hypothetical protein
MREIGVPGPEPDWESAAAYQGGKRNPALQVSLWEWVACDFHSVGELAVPLEALAARLRLTIEHTWEDPGPVDVALFRIARTEFVLSHRRSSPHTPTFIWVRQDTADVEEALSLLLGALGLGRESLGSQTEDQKPWL